MQRFSITIAVSKEVHKAAIYTVGVLQQTDPAMLGQFLDYDGMCKQFVKGVLVELDNWIHVDGRIEPHEFYCNDGNPVCVLQVFQTCNGALCEQLISVQMVL